jgi:uncharacterized protein YjbI with pentapeptide repeats
MMFFRGVDFKLLCFVIDDDTDCILVFFNSVNFKISNLLQSNLDIVRLNIVRTLIWCEKFLVPSTRNPSKLTSFYANFFSAPSIALYRRSSTVWEFSYF